MTWKTAWFCVSCNGELTEHQVMYSNGRCQLCGHKGKSAVTIVDTKERAYKNVLVKKNPWWKLKRNEYMRVYKDE